MRRPAVPGTRYFYWAGRPKVCLLVADDCVVTVVTRVLCGKQLPPAYLRSAPKPAVDELRWRWDGSLDEAA
jgi:hypothetical protein